HRNPGRPEFETAQKLGELVGRRSHVARVERSAHGQWHITFGTRLFKDPASALDILDRARDDCLCARIEVRYVDIGECAVLQQLHDALCTHPDNCCHSAVDCLAHNCAALVYQPKAGHEVEHTSGKQGVEFA